MNYDLEQIITECAEKQKKLLICVGNWVIAGKKPHYNYLIATLIEHYDFDRVIETETHIKVYGKRKKGELRHA